MNNKFRTIKIYCQNCNTLLYQYHKIKPGHLVKCYLKKIKKDYTKGDLKCPNCGEKFARETIIKNKKANKIIQGKVYVKK